MTSDQSDTVLRRSVSILTCKHRPSSPPSDFPFAPEGIWSRCWTFLRGAAVSGSAGIPSYEITHLPV